MITRPLSRPEQIAEAYLALAKADHYMLGFTHTVTDDERDSAEQVLITEQNCLPDRYIMRRKQYDLALDLLDHDRKRRS